MAPRQDWVLLTILDKTVQFFTAKKLENPRLQAELLLADVLGIKRLELYLQFERQLTAEEVDAYREYVRQRATGKPIQYITGESAFRHVVLSVGEGVLIPRPETEVLVEMALKHLRPLEEPAVLDLCCGSGAIAVSLSDEHQGARVVATDITPEAVARTADNAERNKVEARVEARQGDLFAALAADERFDAIVSNPPYVRHGDIAGLDEDVRDFEPHLALDGGEDGLDFYRAIAAEAGGWLKDGGRLFLEVGAGQAEAVAQLLAASQWQGVEIHPDLADIPRVVEAALSPA